MKLTGYILAFYLILLAAIPCCAFDNCPDDKAGTTADHENGDSDCGNCSPFFNCEGCATATITNELPPFEMAAIINLQVYTIYIQTQLPQVDYDFWQPPRIG
ncbi:MAG: DUF6660 family protein [Bacteroidota bacterium]